MKILIYIAISLGMMFSSLAFAWDIKFSINNKTAATIIMKDIQKFEGQLYQNGTQLFSTSKVPISPNSVAGFRATHSDDKVLIFFTLYFSVNNVNYPCVFKVNKSGVAFKSSGSSQYCENEKLFTTQSNLITIQKATFERQQP